MTVAGFSSDAEDKNAFGTKIAEVVSTGTPVSSIQFLKGRRPSFNTLSARSFRPADTFSFSVTVA